MKGWALLFLALIVLIGTPSRATTWVEATVEDPISGAPCFVDQLTSFGSYVYNWPTKYDLVFSPVIDRQASWYCAKSGYASFFNDFDKLTEAEKQAIAGFLSAADNLGDDPTRELLALRLEDVYRLRNKDDAFWAWFYRVRAVWSSNPDEANEYRRKALVLLERSIPKLKGTDLVDALFLCGRYKRLFGDTAASDAYLAQARRKRAGSSDYRNYMRELIDDVIAGRDVEHTMQID